MNCSKDNFEIDGQNRIVHFLGSPVLASQQPGRFFSPGPGKKKKKKHRRILFKVFGTCLFE